MKIEITDESDAFILLNAIKYVRMLYCPITMTRHAIDHLIERFEKELKEFPFPTKKEKEGSDTT